MKKKMISLLVVTSFLAVLLVPVATSGQPGVAPLGVQIGGC